MTSSEYGKLNLKFCPFRIDALGNGLGGLRIGFPVEGPTGQL